MRDWTVPVWAVIRLEPGDGYTVRDALILFESPKAADLYAVEHGLLDYRVCPVTFAFDQARPAGSPRPLP